MRTCQVIYVFLVGARFWYGVPCVDHNDKSGAVFVFHIVMQIGQQVKMSIIVANQHNNEIIVCLSKINWLKLFHFLYELIFQEPSFPPCLLPERLHGLFALQMKNHHGGYCE